MARTLRSAPDITPSPSSASTATSATGKCSSPSPLFEISRQTQTQTVHSLHGAIGDQGDLVGDVMASLSGMALADHGTADRAGAPAARRPHEDAAVISPNDRVPIVPQMIVNVTVHAHNSSVHIYTAPTSVAADDGARIVSRVLRGSNSIHILQPRRILHATLAMTAAPTIPSTTHGGAIPTISPALPQVQSLPETPIQAVGTLPQVPLAADTPPPEDVEEGMHLFFCSFTTHC